MTWRDTARLFGAALAVFTLSVATVRPASAQDIERMLAGIRLGSKSTTVLAKFGNPNDVVIGDVGIRGTGPGGAQSNPGGGPPGEDKGSGLPSPSGFPGFPSGGGGGAPGHGPVGQASGGGGGSAAAGSATDNGGGPPGGGFGGFPGAGGPPQAPYGSGNGDQGGGGGGPFGNTLSSQAPQQEVTWIYNRKVNNNLVSYEFLIGPNGDVSQIRVTGYSGAGVKTKRGIGLGSTYKDVNKVYGYPEEHAQFGRVLVTNYKKAYHLSFQFLNESGQANLLAGGNKVIAITIATVE